MLFYKRNKGNEREKEVEVRLEKKGEVLLIKVALFSPNIGKIYTPDQGCK